MHRKRNGILCLKDLKMKLHFEEGGFHIKGIMTYRVILKSNSEGKLKTNSSELFSED